MNNLYEMFPEVNKQKTPIQQLYRVLDELVEVEYEIKANNRELQLKETIDVIHAAVGLLHKSGYSIDEVNSAIKFTYEKNKSRGYYTPIQSTNHSKVYK